MQHCSAAVGTMLPTNYPEFDQSNTELLCGYEGLPNINAQPTHYLGAIADHITLLTV